MLHIVLSLSEDYTVLWFNDETDLRPYITGLNKALYDEYDEAVYDWKWRRNPNKRGFTSIAVVEHKTDGPVAFNSFLPLEIRRGEKIFRASVLKVSSADTGLEKLHPAAMRTNTVFHFIHFTSYLFLFWAHQTFYINKQPASMRERYLRVATFS